MIEKKFASYYPVCYRLLFAAMITAILIESVGYVVGIPKAEGWHWMVISITLLLLLCLNYGKTGVKVISCIILTFGILFMIPLVGAGQIVSFFSNYVYWLFRSGEYNDQWQLGYQLIQTVWVTMGCYIYQMLTERRAWMKSITALILSIALIVCMILRKDMNHIGVVVCIGYILLWYVETVRQSWIKKKVRDLKEYSLFLVPFFLAFMLALVNLPTSDEPYQWTTVRNIYGRISEAVTILWENITRNDKEDFGPGVTGFSEDGGHFGGLFQEENKLLMTVRGDVSLQTNLYLRGRTYDTFDGREWFKTVEDNTEEYPIDTLETLYAVRRYNEEYQSNYLHRENAIVEYNFFDTGVLFTPLKMINTQYEGYHIEGRDFAFEKQVGYGTEYNLSYFQMNLGTPEFMEMMGAELPEDESEWNHVVRSLNSDTHTQYTLEELNHYRQHMQENYLKDIVLTENLNTYVDEITKGCETPFQRMKAIEKDLSRFTYTNLPDKLPKSINSQEEFLEYFLLESREGYCAYFATTFVLLARAEGLPARYVEGFCVPVIEEKEMEVYSKSAHAWPEVYFEGVGWIPFEPTPGYGDALYDSWQVKKKKTEGVSTEADKGPSPTEEPGIQQDEPKELEQKEKKENAERFRLIGMSILVVILICILILITERLISKIQYRRMNREEQFLVEAKRNLWIFARLGYKREISETLSELQERIHVDYPKLFEGKLELVFLKGYQEYLYRQNEISEEILKETIREREELLALIKEEHRWFYYTLVVGIILSPVW